MSDPAVIATLVNGVPAAQLAVSDRGLHYGDGVFETLAVRAGRACLWDRHMARLASGCARLAIPMPDPDRLLQEAAALCAGAGDAVLKIIVTRGSGPRGYRSDGCGEPTRILQCLPAMTDAPAPARAGIRARLCTLRLAHNPVLAGIKHLNRLEQVLARAEWTDATIREGLLCDPAGNLVEGTMSNVFLVQGDTLTTPDLGRCGVAGVLRELLLELAAGAGIACAVRDVPVTELAECDGLFVCNSLIGIWPVVRCDDHTYEVGELTRALQRRLGETLDDDR